MIFITPHLQDHLILLSFTKDSFLVKAVLGRPPLEGSIALRFARSTSRFPPHLAAPGLSLSHPHRHFPTFNPARITDCPASSPSTCGSGDKQGVGGGGVHVTILSSVVVTCVAEAQGKDICNDPPSPLFLLCPLTRCRARSQRRDCKRTMTPTSSEALTGGLGLGGGTSLGEAGAR